MIGQVGCERQIGRLIAGQRTPTGSSPAESTWPMYILDPQASAATRVFLKGQYMGPTGSVTYPGG